VALDNIAAVKFFRCTRSICSMLQANALVRQEGPQNHC